MIDSGCVLQDMSLCCRTGLGALWLLFSLSDTCSLSLQGEGVARDILGVGHVCAPQHSCVVLRQECVLCLNDMLPFWTAWCGSGCHGVIVDAVAHFSVF